MTPPTGRSPREVAEDAALEAEIEANEELRTHLRGSPRLAMSEVDWYKANNRPHDLDRPATTSLHPWNAWPDHQSPRYRLTEKGREAVQ